MIQCHSPLTVHNQRSNLLLAYVFHLANKQIYYYIINTFDSMKSCPYQYIIYTYFPYFTLQIKELKLKKLKISPTIFRTILSLPHLQSLTLHRVTCSDIEISEEDTDSTEVCCIMIIYVCHCVHIIKMCVYSFVSNCVNELMCVCVWVCERECVCVCVRVCVCVCVCVCIYMCVCMCVWVWERERECVCVCICVCVWERERVCVCVCVCVRA